MKRTVGKRLWSLNKQVVVFLNDEYLGDDQDVMAYISGKYYMTLEMDFCQIGKQQLIESLEKETKKGVKNYNIHQILYPDSIVVFQQQ